MRVTDYVVCSLSAQTVLSYNQYSVLLHTGIGIGIGSGYQYCYRPVLLDTGYWVVCLVSFKATHSQPCV